MPIPYVTFSNCYNILICHLSRKMSSLEPRGRRVAKKVAKKSTRNKTSILSPVHDSDDEGTEPSRRKNPPRKCRQNQSGNAPNDTNMQRSRSRNNKQKKTGNKQQKKKPKQTKEQKAAERAKRKFEKDKNQYGNPPDYPWTLSMFQNKTASNLRHWCHALNLEIPEMYQKGQAIRPLQKILLKKFERDSEKWRVNNCGRQRPTPDQDEESDERTEDLTPYEHDDYNNNDDNHNRNNIGMYHTI